jgi:hypothetical protein
VLLLLIAFNYGIRGRCGAVAQLLVRRPFIRTARLILVRLAHRAY